MGAWLNFLMITGVAQKLKCEILVGVTLDQYHNVHVILHLFLTQLVNNFCLEG